MGNRLLFPTWLSEGGGAYEYLHTDYLCFVKYVSQCLSPCLIGNSANAGIASGLFSGVVPVSRQYFALCRHPKPAQRKTYRISP